MVHFADNSVARIVKNGIFQAVQFLSFIISGIVFIPYLVKVFGADNFGLIALSAIIIQYIGVISGCVGASVARFLSVAINKGNWKEAREVFSTSIAANLLFIFVQLPVISFILWKLDWIINYDIAVEFQFKCLVASSFFVFIVGIFEGVFRAPVVAINRIDLFSKVTSLQVIARIVMIYALINLYKPQLLFIALVDSFLALVKFGLVFFLYKKYRMKLCFSIKSIRVKLLRPVLAMSGWMIVAAIGFCLFRKTDIWLVNRFVSGEMAGYFAALLIWPNFLVQFGNQVSCIISPVYIIDYARNDVKRLSRISLFLAKNLSCFACIAAGVLCANSNFILSLWMPSLDISSYDLLFKLIVLNVVLTLNQAAFAQLFTAVNKVVAMSVCTASCGLLNIILSILLIHLGYGAKGVAIGTLISAGLLYGFCYPVIASRILHETILSFIKVHISGLFCLCSVYMCSEMLNLLLDSSSVVISFVKIIIGVSIGFAVSLCMQSKLERRFLYDQMIALLKRIDNYSIKQHGREG